MSESALRDLAIKRLTQRQHLFEYLWVWLGVSVLVVSVWAMTDPGSYFWPAWPILGMGIGAGTQALALRGGISNHAIDVEAARLSQQSLKTREKG